MQAAEEACAQLEDELLFCEDCRLYFRDSCPHHGTPTFVSDRLVLERMPSRALLTLPEGLAIKERLQGGLGIWCTLPTIPRGCIFGPFDGDILTDKNDCTVFSWALRENGSYYYVDASDESKANWMRYVACASSEEEHNLTVFQYRSKIYYRACQTIAAGAELLVWIGEEYARTLGLKLGEHFKYEFGEKELLMKLFQDLQSKVPDVISNHVSPRDQYNRGDLVASIIHAHKANLQSGGICHMNRDAPGTLLEGTQNLVSLGRAQSRYWTFFGFQGDAMGRILDKTKIICKLCGVRLSYSGNTTNLRQHLIYKHRHEYNELVGGTSIPPKGVDTYPKDFSSRTVTGVTPPVGRTTRAILEFIVSDLLPLKTIEGEGFIQMMSVLEPTYKIPTVNFFAQAVLQDMHAQAKLRVLDSMKSLQHCAVSIDLWKHECARSYVTVIVHHIDGAFDFKHRVLSTRPVTEETTAENIKMALLEIANEWGIRERTSHSVMVSNVDVRLAASKAGWKTLPCIGHVLQNCVDAALLQPLVLRVLTRCKRLMEYVSSLPALSDKLGSSEPFLKVQSKIFLAGSMKWYSTHNALQSLQEHRHFLDSLAEGQQEKGLALRPDDWQVVHEIVDILKPLAIATSTFTKERFSSLSLVKPVITSLVYKHLAANESDSEMAHDIKHTICADLNRWYSDREVNQILNLACALDPRFRGLDFLSQAERVETLHALKREAAELAQLHPVEGGRFGPELPSAGPDVAKKPKHDSGIEFLLGDLCNVRSVSANSVNQQAEQEISNFQTSEASSLCQDPLQWWKTHHTQYPLLANAARKLLAVPATVVPANWIFTEAGDGIYSKRSALAPEHVDMLVFMHGNHKTA
ncbi:E3 SUMO-protein ligase ZBED1-like isoform X1 [Scyliorhinus canicula]|uniref:E3 SUMO-protein ligase ZBED1-like isoform X1 n=2 Tax=Scyliorhinus canicula TaxID=7830 RepID=UPI0018F6A792|nr:E3 SUMO-protein ligase ZBED1-like isoform X1 [Scyliorhinus canicula]XP_038639491.1 E3 SUMO-protein ligase ZBED1-like isoform X1 [Scyliorhinus canicula]